MRNKYNFIVAQCFLKRGCLYILLCLLSGCGVHYVKQVSYASLSSSGANSEITMYEIYTSYLSIDKVQISALVGNYKVLKGYEEVGYVPIKHLEEGTIAEYQKKIFAIGLRLRADGDGATFAPLSTKLYLKKQSVIYPGKVFYTAGKDANCLGVDTSRFSLVKEDNVPIPNRPSVFKSKGNNEAQTENDWACIQLHFDVPTPDPSQKFRLELGEITNPEGKQLHPTIYFRPVTVKQALYY